MQIRWNPDILGITDGTACKLSGVMESLRIGALLHSSWYLKLEANNRAGHQITAERMHNHQGELGVSPRVWNLSISAPIVVKRPTPPGSKTCTQAISEWPQLHQCFRFFLHGTSDFCLEVDSKIGSLHIQFLKSDIVRLTCEASESNADDRCMDTAILSLGFVSGMLGHEFVRRSQKHEAIEEETGRARHTWTKSLYSPFGPETQNWEFSPQAWQRMLACAMEFLYEPERAYVNQQLVALWNSVGSSFSTSSLIACSVLEGLCNQINEPVPTVLTKGQLMKIQELVASDAFSELSVNQMDLAGRKELATRVNNALSP